jgi:hypothetical protein
VIDLRDDDERRADAAPRPQEVTTMRIPLDVSEDRAFWSVWRTGPQFATPLYYGPHLERFPERNAAVLAAIADAPPGGVVFQVALLVLTIAGVPPDVIASDYALSFGRLPARYGAYREPDQGPVIQRYLAERGTTAEAVIVELLANLDVPRVLHDGGLSDAQMDRLRNRLLDAS